MIENFRVNDNLSKDVTFFSSKTEKVHRWFPYLEGFSERFIEDIISGLKKKPEHIYEPFAGSGTLPVYSKIHNINLSYSEINPFLQRLIDIKLKVLTLESNARINLSKEILKVREELISSLILLQPSEYLINTFHGVFPELIYFDSENFEIILKVRTFTDSIENLYIRELVEIASCEALLHSSLLTRAGDIRYKKGKELNQIDKFDIRVCRNLQIISDDLTTIQGGNNSSSTYYTPNSKVFDSVLKDTIDLVITSPPYLNGTNYIRNTKLELWYLGYLQEKKDLSHYRKLVVTAGINDVSKEIKSIELPSLKSVLEDKSLWYDKRIPKMINDYFFDMNLVFNNLHQYVKQGGLALIDIGDSIYGGIHIKTDEILIEILEQNDFLIDGNIQLRQRKSKGGEMVKQTLIIARKR